MSILEDFRLLSPILSALPADILHTPHMPVHAIVHEAEDLHEWSMQDRAALAAKGLNIRTIRYLEPASGALRYTEAELDKVRFSGPGAQEFWMEHSPQGFELRDRLLNDFLFAYRNNALVLGQVRTIAEGNSGSNMVHDLMKLSALGTENHEELDRISFDPVLLERAMVTADRMATLLGEHVTESTIERGAREWRDRAFTHLHRLMTDIRDYGRYVFYRNEERYRGYISSYYRKTGRSGIRTETGRILSQPAVLRVSPNSSGAFPGSVFPSN